VDRPSLIESLRAVLSTAAAIIDSRLSLAVFELREAQSVLLKSLALTGLAVICLGLMLIFLAGFVVIAFWDTHRLASVASVAGIFGLSSALLGSLALAQLRAVHALFGATRTELTKDRQALTGAS
jgi:uncharacterized membrane protein YqjE